MKIPAPMDSTCLTQLLPYIPNTCSLALGWEKEEDDEDMKPWKDLRLMDPYTLIMVTFPEARDLILYAEDDKNIQGLEGDA